MDLKFPQLQSGALDLSYGRGGLYGSFLKNLEPIAEGSESSVFRGGNQAIKVSEPYNDKSKATYRQRIDSAKNISEILGDKSTKVVGYYESPNGTRNPVFSQNFISGRPATQEEILKHMKAKGFSLASDGGFEKKVGNVFVTARDLDPDNVRIDTKGRAVVIDADLVYRDLENQKISPTQARKMMRPSPFATPSTGSPTINRSLSVGRNLLPAAKRLGAALGTEAASVGGMALRGAGRLAGPLGVAMTAYDLAQAFPAPTPISEEDMGKALRSYRTGPQPAY